MNDSFTVDSKVLGETREIYVYLPPDMEESGLEYPVIYLLDGHSLHNVCSSFVQHYSGRERMPPAIVVGIASTDRLRDFTPFERVGYDGTHGDGGADDFLMSDMRSLYSLPSVSADLDGASLTPSIL